MTTEEIINNIISKNTTNVYRSACKIISLARKREKIIPLIEYLPLIKEQTKNLNMGGLFAPSHRFVDFAIKIIEFYQNKNLCSCNLYIEEYKLTNDAINREIRYELFDPNVEVENGNIDILHTTIDGKNWSTDYLVMCRRCHKKYKVQENYGHYQFWEWEEYKNN